MVVRPIHEWRLQKLAMGGTLKLRESHTVMKPMTMAGTAKMWNTWGVKKKRVVKNKETTPYKKICGRSPYEIISCRCGGSSRTNGTTIELFFVKVFVEKCNMFLGQSKKWTILKFFLRFSFEIIFYVLLSPHFQSSCYGFNFCEEN